MANNLNFFRGKYSDYLALKDENKVLDTNLYFTIPDDEDKKITNDPKSSSYCLFQGEILLASATHESDIKGILSELDSITSRLDNIGSEIATYTISAVTPSSVNVEAEYALMKTQGETTVVEGETIKIYKDSALKNVAMVNKGTTQFLKFTYTLADGTEKDVEFDVSSLLVASEFKNGLEVSENGEVSVKVGENMTDGDGNVTSKNFLTFEGTVDGNKSLAVRSMDTNKTVTTSDIVIAGGPLDNASTRKALSGGTDDAGNFIIKQGTDIQQLLVSLFTKETYPNALPTTAYTKATASAAMNALTLTLSATGDQEVGTLISLTEGKTNGSKVSSKKNSSITGLTYGWSAANDNKKDSSATAITSTIKADTIADNKYTISATINSGFNADTVTNKKTTPATVTGTSSASLSVTKLGCIEEGANKITINATGASYSYSAASISGGYLVSNVGNTSSAHTYSGISEVNTATTKPTTSANATVTGKYKYFMGYSENTTVGQFDSAKVRALTTKSGWITKDGTTTIVDANNPLTSNGKSIVIACPQKYSLATITNGVGASILGNFTEKGTVTVQTGSINTTYMVYIYPITNGAKVEFKNLTIKK